MLNFRAEAKVKRLWSRNDLYIELCINNQSNQSGSLFLDGNGRIRFGGKSEILKWPMFYSKFLVIIRRQLPGEKANSIRPRANVGKRTSSIWMPSGWACGRITAISISSTTSITIAAINIYPSWNLCGPRWDRHTESSRPIITSPSGWRFRTGVWLTCPAQCDNLATKRQVNHSPIYWSTDGLMATLISTTISRVFKGEQKKSSGESLMTLGSWVSFRVTLTNRPRFGLPMSWKRDRSASS